jgi:hypothetical protein
MKAKPLSGQVSRAKYSQSKRPGIQASDVGLGFLTARQKKQKADGALLLEMVLGEQGDDRDLQGLVSHRALLELILLTIDHQEAIRVRFNNEKSRQSARKKKIARQADLYAWLDKNIDRFKKRLDECAYEASEALYGSEKNFSTIRKEISQYRKIRKTSN